MQADTAQVVPAIEALQEALTAHPASVRDVEDNALGGIQEAEQEMREAVNRAEAETKVAPFFRRCPIMVFRPEGGLRCQHQGRGPNFFQPQHVEHLYEVRPEIADYLGLPPGPRSVP
jgi:hypothetical protein